MKYLMMLMVLVMVGCSGQQKFTDGAYNDARETKLLDDKFNEADMQQMTATMVASLVQCPRVPQNYPTLMVDAIENQTSEHVNTVAILDQIQTSLIKANRFEIVDRPARGVIQQEISYQSSGATFGRIPADQQVPARYLLGGRLSSNVQEVGKDKLVYYKLNLNLTDMKAGTILCAEEKELRKEFRRKSVD